VFGTRVSVKKYWVVCGVCVFVVLRCVALWCEYSAAPSNVLPVIYWLAFLCAPDWTSCTWPCSRTPIVPRSRIRTGSCSRTDKNDRPRKTCKHTTTWMLLIYYIIILGVCVIKVQNVSYRLDTPDTSGQTHYDRECHNVITSYTCIYMGYILNRVW